MTNSNTLWKELFQRLHIKEEGSEKREIIYYLVGHRTGFSKSEIIFGKETSLAASDFENDIARLNQYEPVQYVTGIAWFCGRKFLVNPNVLIPRPETEEIIQWVKNQKPKSPSILDVGTGSGCIAISLALEIKEAAVTALDISQSALTTAQENAQLLHADVSFLLLNALTEMPSGEYDFIVSNPPYLTPQDMEKLSPTVRFEPRLALTPSGHNFYKRLAEWRCLLKPAGKMIVEFVPNEELTEKTLKEVFYEKGFEKVEVKKSAFSKVEFLVGTR